MHGYSKVYNVLIETIALVFYCTIFKEFDSV